MMIIYAIKKREQKTLTKWLCQLNSFSCWFFPFKMHTLCLSTVSQCENLNFFYVRKLIVFWFNEKSTLVGHFVLSPREREKRDGRDERERQGRKRNRNESEETEEIKISPLYPYLLQGLQALPNCMPLSVGSPFLIVNHNLFITLSLGFIA